MRNIFKRGWFQTVLTGIALFILTDVALQHTQNPLYLPTFIMVGAFIVPVAFAAYFNYQESVLDRHIHGRISLTMTAVIFLVGGLVGIIIAGLVEDFLSFDSDWANFLAAGGIEEATKLIFPVAIFIFFTRYRSEVDGLMFGVASGIGFAALETMGYGLNTIVSPFTTFRDLEQILVIRGLFSPLGHAAWTALVCGAIWHYQGQGRKLIIMATAFFLLAVVLHFLWNMAASADSNFVIFPSFMAIGGLGLFPVFRHLHHARQRSTALHTELPVEIPVESERQSTISSNKD